MPKVDKSTHYYDFDDTLIPGDYIIYWKRFYFKKRPRMRIWQIFTWIGLVAYLLRLINSLTLKKIFLIPTAYESKEELENLAKEFTQKEIIPRLYSDMIDQLRQKMVNSENIVVISASPIFYLKYLKEYYPGITIVGTEFDFPQNGIIRIPRFSSKWGNMKGKTKVKFILHNLHKPRPNIESASFGYSDSGADIPLLDFVDTPIAINPNRKLRKKALQCDWKIYIPKNAPSTFQNNLMKIFNLLFDIGEWPKKSEAK